MGPMVRAASAVAQGQREPLRTRYGIATSITRIYLRNFL